jgi:hypothetical protein
MPASTVGRETGDCVVVAAADGERVGVPGEEDSAPAVNRGVGTMVGSVVTAVSFWVGAAVPAASLATEVPGVTVTVVTEGVPEEVGVAVAIATTAGVGDVAIGAIIAETGTVTAKTRSRIHGRT